ncbi:hypothetical protein MK416_00035 [Streptococcus oralis]|uniref:hypothetical protein n=1 Tax=Streptococcus oralis TaxID=1303 RepID=UPI0022839479|nr:hypothetical protein [Streptococcus oralis]MCY7070795.1 hypothetical protein [Streptococcus oralis]
MKKWGRSMSGLYFEVRSRLRRKFNWWEDIGFKFFEVVLLLLLILYVVDLVSSNSYASNTDFLNVLIFFFIYRGFAIFRKNKVINIAIQYNQNNILTPEDIDKLLKEIKKSINSTRDLIKWGMGIFATIMIALLSIVSTLFSKIFDLLTKNISETELLNYFKGLSIESIVIDWIKVLFSVLIIVVVFLFVIYIILDLFTYDRRFVYNVLINFQYRAFQIGELEEKRFWSSFKEIFFIDYS